MDNKKCGCGKTKNADGTCDGSHVVKTTAFDKITIRCISTGEPQREKFMYPNIASNKRLLKNVGFVISDPNYESKMEAFKTKKSYTQPSGAVKSVKNPEAK